MKTLFSLITIVLISLCISVQGQDFQNLNFEAADPQSTGNPLVPWAVTSSSALPGWSGSLNGAPATEMWFNNFSTGAPEIDLFGPGYTYPYGGVIDGDYSVLLQSLAYPGTTEDTSISQTATIPSGTQSLQLKAWNFGGPGGGFEVSINGNILSPVVLFSSQSASGQPYTEYGFNIAAYAGNLGELQITTTVPNGNALAGFEFDDISFLPTAVPEPSISYLTALGGLVVGRRKLFARC